MRASRSAADAAAILRQAKNGISSTSLRRPITSKKLPVLPSHRALSTLRCTCAVPLSPSTDRSPSRPKSSTAWQKHARSLHTSSSAHATVASTSSSTSSAVRDLPILTEPDKQRLRKIRNVGISAHIDRCVGLDPNKLICID